MLAQSCIWAIRRAGHGRLESLSAVQVWQYYSRLQESRSFWSWPWLSASQKEPSAKERLVTKSSFGHTWKDPYSWMELKDKGLSDYLLQEQQHFGRFVTENLLDSQQILQKEAKALSSPGDKGPSRERIGDYEYFTRVSEEKPEDNYLRVDLRSNRIQPVLDINELVEGYNEQLEIGQLKISPSQKLIAFTVNFQFGAGKVLVKDIASGKILESLNMPIHTLEWQADDNGFIYTTMQDGVRPSKVYRHCIGDLMGNDVPLLEEHDKANFLSLTKSKDAKFIFICSNSKTASEVHFIPADSPESKPRLIQAREAGLEYHVEHWRDQFLILTNADGHTNNCLMTADISDPSRRRWQMCVPERPDVAIEDLDVFKRFLVLWERQCGHAAFSILYHAQDEGKLNISGHESFFAESSREQHGEYVVRAFDQHTCKGTVQISLSANADSTRDEFAFKVSSPIMHDQHVKVRVSSEGAKGLTSATSRKFPKLSEEYSCWQEICTSADNTDIPMTLARNEKFALPGACLLECYGAYGINLDLSYNPYRVALMRRGWTIAYAHVRGGGEKGRSWHHSGRQSGKLLALQDAQACVQQLHALGVAERGKVALHATSAGGLLAANLYLSDPGAFGALVLRMPFLDLFTAMMDSEALLTQHEWDEWGDPLKGVALLEQLCPYQNLQKLEKQDLVNANVLITAGALDERTPIWMAAKWMAALRKRTKQGSNEFLHVEPCGHYLSLADSQQLSALEAAFMLHCIE